MSSLEPRPPYTAAELAKLYPADLELTKVQLLVRHGERTPVTVRFKNAGLPSHWPYCDSINRLQSVIRNADGTLDALTWRRKLEIFGKDDEPSLAVGPRGEASGMCQPGELTNKGRETTLAFGERARQLYVDQLGLLPEMLDATTLGMVYLRTSPINRARESTEQAFTGLYPLSKRAADLPPPAMVTRYFNDETLFPNDTHCKRLKELYDAFGARAAERYNDGPEMAYINQKIGKWMPASSPVVKVDSHPRLTGIMDTTNATLGHGKDTRLPGEFCDPKVRQHTDRICSEEWFAGYQESNEYRTLGIGPAVGDVTQHMVEHVRSESAGKGDDSWKLSINGCHDTTIGATLAALGAFDVRKDTWPRFTSNIAIELFKAKDSSFPPSITTTATTGTVYPSQPSGRTWFTALTSAFWPSSSSTPVSARAPLTSLPPPEQQRLDSYFVRLRYNDVPVTLPACKAAGKHWRDDETFCTLAAFKEATDSFTPKNWKRECDANLGKPGVPGRGDGIEVERPFGVAEE